MTDDAVDVGVGDLWDNERSGGSDTDVVTSTLKLQFERETE